LAAANHDPKNEATLAVLEATVLAQGSADTTKVNSNVPNTELNGLYYRRLVRDQKLKRRIPKARRKLLLLLFP